ncbi:MAG: urate hydroxylase PuuD [Rhizobiales bacterium]|nr:urate hydroxylase PuuD [Hyphomicrobiales bacterium]MBO6699787.1 urate hydroxylase PuuD [Hyphomicrobiales bacterium]MBO6737325.1 urate hydroxylase PuuD [Hyphomicrobiales bacterium]MBO6911601.1 urate hydroxylase PuuD [Hyphomicrobiales bacterium]MBO6954977.1 urate hydroxylase PuuD [Hyphomicrobiales bacterium]
MFDLFVLGDWLEFVVRWLHVITAIAWIGSSFYFIALDLGLRRDVPLPEGVSGEEWQVHGGGFYHINKYMVAPSNLPEHLVWFKWEAYWTWISGFALLVLVYYFGSDLFLIDPHVMDLAAWQAIGISVVSLVAGWVLYSSLCNSKLGDNPPVMMGVLFLIIVAFSFFYAQVFSGRAALLHLGAFTATIMVANVAMVIIPNQKIVVTDMKAGRVPDAKYGKIAKLRSTHNNYLTLPVLFLMLSIHYPLAFASEYNWIIAALVFLVGVFVRHFFNNMHATKEKLVWPWFAAAATMLVIAVLSMAPMWNGHDPWEDETSMSPRQERFAAAPGFEEVSAIVLGRCSMCHAQEPTWFDTYWAPKGVRLETEWQVAQHAHTIVMQAGYTHAMPPQNVSGITDEERALIVAWYRAGRQGVRAQAGEDEMAARE